MTNKMKTGPLPVCIYFILALIGGYFAFQTMKWGPWAYSDSSAYVSAARNFASGNGLTILHSTGKLRTVSEFPPFFPMLLSLLGRNNSDYVKIIRSVNVALFFLSIITFSKILYSASHKHILSIIGTLFFISFPVIISTYSSAMSEPIFLFFVLVSLYIVQLFVQKNEKKYLILFIIISSLLPITRYAGILFVSVYGLCLLIVLKQFPLLKKIKLIFSYYVLSLLPVGIWGFSLFQKYRKFGGKSFKLNLSIIGEFIKSIREQLLVLKFWIPYVELYQNTFIEKIMLFISFLVLSFLIYFMVRNIIENKSTKQKNQKYLFIFSISLIMGYILFIGLTHSITVPQIDIIDRMMIPIYPLFILVLFVSIDTLLLHKGQRWFIPTLLILFSLIILRFNILTSNLFIKNMRAEGLGFTSREYQQAGIIDAIKQLSPGQEMVSNSSGFILFYDNRYPIQIENFPDHVFGTGDTYGEKSFREKNAALIILFSDFSNYYNDHAGIFLHKITDSLTIKYLDNEGGIYFYPK